MVSLIGAIIGGIAAFPILYYLYKNPIHVSGELAKVYAAYGLEPIIPFSVEPAVFYVQTIAVFIIALVVSIYPLLFIRKIQPVAALQGRGAG
jgi:ABC-type antimicrobial peptide transport system permease subunit